MTFDSTKPVQTRCGYPARILATDLKNPEYPVVAAVVKQSGTEFIETYTKSGDRYENARQNDLDLINIPTEHVRWVNIFPISPVGDCWSISHETREAADDRAQAAGVSRIACLRIEFTEGEGL